MSLASSGSNSKQYIKDSLAKTKEIVDKYMESSKRLDRLRLDEFDEDCVDQAWDDDTLEERLELIHSEMTSFLSFSTSVQSPKEQIFFAKKAQSSEVHSEKDQQRVGKGFNASWLQDGPLLKDSEQFSDLVVMISLANNDSPLWNSSVFDPGSETRTIDHLDTSDDTTLKGVLSAILTRVVEEWQAQRTEIETLVAHESREASNLREVSSLEASIDLLHHVKPRIETLWWGQEVVWASS